MAEEIDGLRYIAGYPDLIAALGANAAAGRQHYESSGRAEGRDPLRFNPLWYGASNADVARGIGLNTDGLSTHYINFGYYEGRSTSSFDGYLYGASNPDLITGIGANLDGLYSHYIGFGLQEGRATSGFDALRYGASNADLARFYGADAAGLTEHYVRFGFNEGRVTATFDAFEYLASNPDLVQVGVAPAEAMLHYLQYGADEGRLAASFDALLYGASNPDLARAYGTDAAGLTRHYVEVGIAEGRVTTGFDSVQYAAANTDLAVAGLGTNAAAALNHYLNFGADEGRSTSGFDPVAYKLTYSDLAGRSDAMALDHWVRFGAREGRVGDSLYGREQPSHVANAAPQAIDFLNDRDWYDFQVPTSAAYHIALDFDFAPPWSGRGYDLLFRGPSPLTLLGTYPTFYYESVLNAGSYIVEVRGGEPLASYSLVILPIQNHNYQNGALGAGTSVVGSDAAFDIATLSIGDLSTQTLWTGFDLQSVDRFSVDNRSAYDVTIDMGGATGLDFVQAKYLNPPQLAQGVTFTNIGDVANLAVEGAGSGRSFGFQFLDTAVAGSDTSVVLRLVSSQIDTLTIGSMSAPSGGVENLTIHFGGAIQTLNSDVTSLYVNGSLTVLNALGITVRSVRFDGGNANLSFANHGAAEGVRFDGAQRTAGSLAFNEADTLIGGAGADLFISRGGIDILNGGGGDDILVGGGRDDMLTGGAGADRFVLDAFADKGDIISDFLSGTDVIDLIGIADQPQLIGATIRFAGNAGSLLAAQQAVGGGGNTLDAVYQTDTNTLWFDNGDDILNGSDVQIVLTGVGSLSAADVLHGAIVTGLPQYG